MKPKYFIVCSPEVVGPMCNCPNPLDFAYHHDLTIVDESHDEFEKLVRRREIFPHITHEEHEAKITGKFKRKNI